MKKVLFNLILIILTFLLFQTTFAVNNELVYVDKNNIDIKYHRITCDHIFPNGYKSITVEQAFNQGYRRCPDCSPPLSDTEMTERKKEFDNIISSVGGASNNTKNADTTIYVYVNTNTNSSAKYHMAGCDELVGKTVKVTLENAKKYGYGDCNKCKPYTADVEKKSISKIIILTSIVILFVFLIIFVIHKIDAKRNLKNNENYFDDYNIKKL